MSDLPPPVGIKTNASYPANAYSMISRCPARNDSCPKYCLSACSIFSTVKRFLTPYVYFLRQGSNERDSSSSPERSRPVILSAAKDLCAQPDRSFAALRMTLCDCSNCQGLFFNIEPCLNRNITYCYFSIKEREYTSRRAS